MDKRFALRWMQLLAAALLTCALLPNGAHAERVEDIASVGGVRVNQLVGYGLVVGLNGTGDQTTQAPFTVQSVQNMLAKFGVTIPANLVFAAFLQDRPDHRCDRGFDRQCAQPARRRAADDASARRGRGGVCGRAG
jgi:hypothetical protein